jgi:hypothetical protein
MMKSFVQFKESVRAVTKSNSGTSSSFTWTFDKSINDKVTRSNTNIVNRNKGSRFTLPRGSIVSVLPGGIFAIFPDRSEEPKYSNEKYGVPIQSTEDNVKALAKVL